MALEVTPDVHDDVTVVGESLGGAPACRVHLPALRTVQALLLEQLPAQTTAHTPCANTAEASARGLLQQSREQ